MERPPRQGRDEQDAGKEPDCPLTRYRSLFVQRGDAYGRQRNWSRLYYRVRSPLTDEVLTKHLRGEVTIGLYSLDPSGTTRWTVMDSDRGLGPIVGAQADLAKRGIPSYLESSRAGGHLWTFWDKPVSPTIARRIIEPSAPNLECFPAGDIPDLDGYGLLIRAPLGIHRFSGRRYPFIHPSGEPVSTGKVRGQIDWLAQNVRRVDPAPHAAQLPILPTAGEHPVYGPKNTEQSPIRQWVEEHPIRDVIERYVRLNKAGVGRCPWGENHKHGDKHPSFTVYERTQRWWCFAERRGGNGFDFLAQYHHLTPSELLRKIRNGSY